MCSGVFVFKIINRIFANFMLFGYECLILRHVDPINYRGTEMKKQSCYINLVYRMKTLAGCKTLQCIEWILELKNNQSCDLQFIELKIRN